MKGPLGLASEKIRIKRTGTSETMCFENCFGCLPPHTKKELMSLNIKAEL